MSKTEEPEFYKTLDKGIAHAVKLLHESGVETYESCEGPGEKTKYDTEHSYPEPTIRFFGARTKGFHVFHICMTYGLPISSLRRLWKVTDGELTGPDWEITFYRKVPCTKDCAGQHADAQFWRKRGLCSMTS